MLHPPPAMAIQARLPIRPALAAPADRPAPASASGLGAAVPLHCQSLPCHGVCRSLGRAPLAPARPSRRPHPHSGAPLPIQRTASRRCVNLTRRTTPAAIVNSRPWLPIGKLWRATDSATPPTSRSPFTRSLTHPTSHPAPLRARVRAAPPMSVANTALRRFSPTSAPAADLPAHPPDALIRRIAEAHLLQIRPSMPTPVLRSACPLDPLHRPRPSKSPACTITAQFATGPGGVCFLRSHFPPPPPQPHVPLERRHRILEPACR